MTFPFVQKLLTRLAACLVVIACLLLPAVAAQSEAQMRQEANQGTIGLISGGVSGTYIRIASDMAAVLDDGNKLRVLPILGKGSLQNIKDLLYLRGVDIAIVQSDVLAYIRDNHVLPNIEQRIRYITKLYNEEFHLLAGPGINQVGDLAGRKVNFDVDGSGTFLTASTVFRLLGVQVEPTHFDQALALEKVKSGEIAAMVYVAGKPAELFRNLDASSGVHLVSVPVSDKLLETYLPSSFTNKDYPLLVSDGQTVDTLAVGAVMAVFNWNKSNERYGRVGRLVTAFFDNFSSFLKPPRHPKWQEVNLAATLPGWVRFEPAEDWLRARVAPTAPGADRAMRSAFQDFLKFMEEKKIRAVDAQLSDQERNALFSEFQKWQEQHGR